MADKRKSYQAFLKAAGKKYELPYAKSQVLYRKLSDRLGKPARVGDLKAHPRISKQEAEAAKRSRGKRKIIRRKKPKAPPLPIKKKIKTLGEWLRLQQTEDSFDSVNLAGGIDYSGGKGRGLVSFQLDMRARVPRGYELTHRVVEQAVHAWSLNGKAPKGFRIAIKDWKDKAQSRERLKPVILAGEISVEGID